MAWTQSWWNLTTSRHRNKTFTFLWTEYATNRIATKIHTLTCVCLQCKAYQKDICKSTLMYKPSREIHRRTSGDGIILRQESQSSKAWGSCFSPLCASAWHSHTHTLLKSKKQREKQSKRSSHCFCSQKDQHCFTSPRANKGRKFLIMLSV